MERLYTKMENFKVGEFPFLILTYLGFWRPKSLKSLWATQLYNLYNIFGLFILFYFPINFIIDSCENIDDTEAIIENVFVFSNILLAACKCTYLNYRKEDIHSLVELFLQQENLPCNVEEDLIYKKCYDNERIIQYIFFVPPVLSETVLILFSFISGKASSLPIMRRKANDFNTKTKFWVTYLYDSIFIFCLALTHASVESILIICVNQIYTHIDIFINRLLKIQNILQNTAEKLNTYQLECNLIKECVNHHLRILLMEKLFNDFFGAIIFCQFFVSIIDLSTTCMTWTNFNLKNGHSWFLIMTTFAFIAQIFIYCYVGDELKQKSLSICDEIYKMDWTTLPTQVKRNLMLIMMRSRQPIQLTGGVIITLSLETFLKIAKASYSAFNLLR